MRGGGGGRNTSNTKACAPPSLPLNPVAPQLDPGLDVVLDRNPLGFSPSSFLGGVHLWTAERCWIAATEHVDTNRGIISLVLLRGASSSSEILFEGLARGPCASDGSGCFFFLGDLDRGTVCGTIREIYFNELHQLYFRYIR